MAKRPTRASKTSSYKVGYGRPPQATQFKPGQSGNPRGRPKGSRSVGSVLNELMTQKISVTEQGRPRRRSAMYLILRRVMQAALQVDANALKLLFSLHNQHADPSETAQSMQQLVEQDREILAAFGFKPSGRSKA